MSPKLLPIGSRHQNVHHFCEKWVTWHLCNSRTKQVSPENSAAIDRGAAPRSKSDEFSGETLLVDEITSLLSLKPPKKVIHILGAPPHISTAPLVKIENSTDLESGRRPELKSVQFSIFTKGVVEKISMLVEIARRLCIHLLGFGVFVLSRTFVHRFVLSLSLYPS